MNTVAKFSAYQSTILTLQGRWLEIQKIQDEEQRGEAFFDLLDDMQRLEDLLTEITSSIELWIMDQPDDDLLIDISEWKRNEAFIKRVQAWQYQIRRAETAISNINSYDLFDAQGVDQAFAVLTTLQDKP